MSTLERLEQKVAEVTSRLERLEQAQAEERILSQWRYLVERRHRWRRQLSLKGRNMTAAQLVATMKANAMTVEQAAADFDLPLEAVEEAARYCEEQKDLIALEGLEERRYLMEKGYRLEPPPVLG